MLTRGDERNPCSAFDVAPINKALTKLKLTVSEGGLQNRWTQMIKVRLSCTAPTLFNYISAFKDIRDRETPPKPKPSPSEERRPSQVGLSQTKNVDSSKSQDVRWMLLKTKRGLEGSAVSKMASTTSGQETRAAPDAPRCLTLTRMARQWV